MERSITDEVLYDRYRYLDLHSHLQHLHGHELKSAGACNRALWLRSDAVTIQVPTTTGMRLKQHTHTHTHTCKNVIMTMMTGMPSPWIRD